jgi:hypothetical protein
LIPARFNEQLETQFRNQNQPDREPNAVPRRKSAGLFVDCPGHSSRYRQLAFAVILLSLLFFLSLAPFARVPLARVFGFVPMYESAIRHQ